MSPFYKGFCFHQRSGREPQKSDQRETEFIDKKAGKYGCFLKEKTEPDGKEQVTCGNRIEGGVNESKMTVKHIQRCHDKI